MALLNICAITGANKVVQIGLVFLRRETEADYNWALDYMRKIMAQNSIEEPASIVTDRELALIKSLNKQFPSSQHLLCRWHVNMNVLARTKQYFPGPTQVNGQPVRHPRFQGFLSSWNRLLSSPLESIYLQRLSEMQAEYPTAAMKYCIDTWLIWKENLVGCFINCRFHFGITVTSPIEGCHATLKSYLQRGHGDLRGVFNKLKNFWNAQYATLQSELAQQQIRPKHSVNIPLFTAILQTVHGYALQKLAKEYAKLPKSGPPLSSCSCSIQQSIGLPCYHTIWERRQEVGVIRLEDIHPHWHVIRPEPSTLSGQSIYPLPVLNPLPVRGRGRPRGALGGVVRPTNTRREPSAFEIPSSSAPPAFNTPQEPIYIVNSGLVRLQNGHQDMYIAGTQAERGYMRGISSIYQSDSLVDAAAAAISLIEGEVFDCIEVDTGI